MKPPVIVNVAVGGRYYLGQERLKRSITVNSEIPVSFFPWCEEYPNGCPLHQDTPYAFKAYAIRIAKDLGYKKILWMDASAWLDKPWGDFWDVFDSRSMMVWSAGCPALGTWCADSSLPLLGITREESFEMQMFEGLVCGFNFEHPEAEDIWNYYWEQANNGSFKGFWRKEHGFVSDDIRVLGHRHDMPALSVACNRYGIDPLRPPKYFARVNDTFRPEEACIFARGI